MSWTSEPDSGVYDAMNKGVRRAAGTYLLFLNAGDVLACDNALTNILAALVGDPAWLVAQAWNASSQQIIGNLPHSWFKHAFGLQSHSHQSTVFSTEVVRMLGGYAEDLGFASDFDLILRFGLVDKPKELYAIVANYEGGGVSEIGANDIPILLHRIRVRRFGLYGLTEKIDLLYSRLQTKRRRLYRMRRRNSLNSENKR